MKTIKSDTDAKYFTRGGQITLHNLRMWTQIVLELFKWSIICQFFLFITIAILTLPTQSISASYTYFLAKFCSKLGLLNQGLNYYHGNKTLTLLPAEILNLEYFREQSLFLIEKSKSAFFVALIFNSFITLLISRWFKKKGESQASNQFIRGAEIAEPDFVAKLLRKTGKASDIVIAGVPMVKRFEVQHTLIHGTVGSGKGQTFNQFLEHIKRRGDRAIIYDKGCVFTELFFNPTTDIILNPFDSRCANWDLWKEALESPDFENLAESLIPMQGENDPFWVNAARTIFSTAAFAMRNDKDRSIERLLKLILTAELDELSEYLSGTEAATLVSEKIEKTAISIRSVISTYVKSLRFLQGLNQSGRNAFSIREWVTNPESSGLLFVSSQGEKHASLKPLISMWLSTASLSLLSLPENYDRRIWFVCDELPTLHKLPLLPETIAEVRKFGGCFVLGMQSFAQLEKVYGRAAAKEMFDLLNTRFFFRSPSAEMARLVSQELGEQEIDESRENYSYGANSIRDGISVGTQRMTKPLVTPAEIMDMEDLTAYLRVPAKVPVCKLKISYQKRKKIADGFIPREILSNSSNSDIGDKSYPSKLLDNESNGSAMQKKEPIDRVQMFFSDIEV